MYFFTLGDTDEQQFLETLTLEQMGLADSEAKKIEPNLCREMCKSVVNK